MIAMAKRLSKNVFRSTPDPPPKAAPISSEEKKYKEITRASLFWNCQIDQKAEIARGSPSGE
jgi:hypothetical protein